MLLFKTFWYKGVVLRLTNTFNSLNSNYSIFSHHFFCIQCQQVICEIAEWITKITKCCTLHVHIGQLCDKISIYEVGDGDWKDPANRGCTTLTHQTSNLSDWICLVSEISASTRTSWAKSLELKCKELARCGCKKACGRGCKKCMKMWMQKGIQAALQMLFGWSKVHWPLSMCWVLW